MLGHQRIQSDQKVSVHLTIIVPHQVHRDFLITLYVKTVPCQPVTVSYIFPLFVSINSC